MSKYLESTPCPVLANSAPVGKAPASHYEDATEDLNFTTEIQAALIRVAPRRKKSAKPGLQAITSLSERATAQHPALMTQGVKDDGRQREKPSAHYRPTSPKGNRIGEAPPRRRLSVLLAEHADACPIERPDQANQVTEHRITHFRKKPRRRTIYIPSDDTTVFTIHPGLQSEYMTGTSGLSLQAENQDSETHGPLIVPNVQIQRSNRSTFTAAPKRVPLQLTLNPLQEIEGQRDVPGVGPGKENIPPGRNAASNAGKDQRMLKNAKRVSIFPQISENTPSSTVASTAPELSIGDRRKSTLRRHCNRGYIEKSSSSQNPKDPRESWMNRRNSLYYGSIWKPSARDGLSPHKASLPSKLTAPAASRHEAPQLGKYTVIREDIDRPEMFEDAWLSDQEFAIQQLINDLFATAHESNSYPDIGYAETRRQLLRLYQTPECLLLYKRLQASLLYGALSPSTGSVSEASRLKCDLGLRERFLKIWLRSYNLKILSASAEVVIGRESPLTLSPQNSGLRKDDLAASKMRKKSVKIFLEICLLRNEDSSETSSSAWCWRRTMLRSLMMIWLLDKAKITGSMIGNLFASSSPFKSSHEVLVELCTLLSTSAGDMSRSLLHLDYSLHHTQYILSEYQYGIQNLATDLRDGVRLTHLVEILLYPPASLTHLHENITVALPTGEVLTTSIKEGPCWVLSQHLKVNCPAVTQKVYNVHVALSALQGIHGICHIVEDLRAEDIVNGHREKTVALLWGLVGKWGLDALVNFDELSTEICRLKRNRDTVETEDFDDEDEYDASLGDTEKKVQILKSWARFIAQSHGIKVSNFTTSFADGQVFGMIVDEYRKYMPESKASKSGEHRFPPSQLDEKLRSIGCSTSFASIFGRNKHGRVFDRDFTIAALAFLASRLLTASRKGRAAAFIGRAYRRMKIRRNLSQRSILLGSAHDCKTVFETRDHVLRAARTLQAAWRAYLRERINGHSISNRRLVAELRKNTIKETFQATGDSVDIWLP